MIMRQTFLAGASCLMLLGVAGCGHSPDQTQSQQPGIATTTGNAAPAADDDTAPVTSASAAPAQSPAPTAKVTSNAQPISCETEIGAAAAKQRVKTCLAVSPATHPPCNVANSCAMMDDEIARSCALFDGKGQPMPECHPAPQSPQAAAAVVQRYYSALNAHDYGTAWQQWGDNGPPHQTQATFAAGFAHTRSTRVTIGTLPPIEGAAGSSYQTVPVTIDATLDDGTHQRFAGDYAVRLVNGIDGATPDQFRWHIDSAYLKAAPAD
jgi:hypothetical protein